MSTETRRDKQKVDLRDLRVQRILDGENEDAILIRELKSQLAAANNALEAKDTALKLKDQEIARLKADANIRMSSEMPGDPDGHYRALGLHPTFAQGLTEEQAREIVQRAWKSYSQVFHTDRGGNLERIKRINAARDVLAPKPKQGSS